MADILKKEGDYVAPWEGFEGKIVILDHRGNPIIEKIDLIDLISGFIDFKPSIIYEPNGECYIEKELPQRIPLNDLLGQDPKYGRFIPVREGYLEKYVFEKNKQFSKASGYGFKHKSDPKLE